MNLLPLDTWRSILSYHPWHFNGWSNSKIPVTSACNTIFREYSWQNANALGRSEMRRAIEQAERRIREQLGFSIAPHYVVDSDVRYPRYHDNREEYLAPINAEGRWLGVFATEKRLQAIGVEALDLVGTATITRTDEDGDGLKEIFTVSAAYPTYTDIKEIAVYFSATERFDGTGLGARWRIEPVDVKISGGVVTVRGPAWLLARPILYQGAVSVTGGLDPDVDGNYPTTLDIVRRHTDPNGLTNDTAQAVMIWETNPYPGWGCCLSYVPGSNATDPAAQAYAIARAEISDPITGLIGAGAAAYDVASSSWYGVGWNTCSPPARMTVRYLAGFPLDSEGHVDAEWAIPVARMAAAEMTRHPCACDTANAEFSVWAFDVSRSSGANDESYTVSREDLVNPFGSRRGMIDAWRKVRSTRLLRGFSQ